MKRNAQLFAVMLGLGVAGWAWAAPKVRGAVGPDVEVMPAVRTQKAVGPGIRIDPAVRTQKTVGPGFRIDPAVRAQKTVAHDEQGAGNSPLLDLNAGF